MTTYYIPATERGTRSRVKKIVAEGNVVVTGAQMTASGARGEWERLYKADIVERITLDAAGEGTAQVRLLSKDRRDRPTDTTMRCADSIVFERTIYDELVNPEVAARAKAVLTNTVRVDHLGYAHAIWADERGVFSDIYSSVRSPGGDWGVNVKVNDETVDSYHDLPAIVVDDRGNVYAVWHTWENIYSSLLIVDPWPYYVYLPLLQRTH